ncbi:hypothetical protein ACHQM5_004476 [Ranunculus cassubicifolius]
MDQENNYNDDIIFSILVCLPAVEARKLRLVCKSWYHIIKSPAFIQSHLRKAKYGLICNKENGIDNTVHDDKILIREFNEKSKTIWSSCNGLVLLAQNVQTVKKHFLLITNPSTQEVMKLPTPYDHRDKDYSHVFGITYVASVKKYVVVHYFILKKPHRQSLSYLSRQSLSYSSRQSLSYSSEFGCETLGLGDDKWKRVYFVHKHTGMEFFSSRKVIFINDVAHMVVLEGIQPYLISMNMIDTKHDRRRMPDNHKDLFEIGGVLSYARLCNDADFEIWSLGDFRKGDWVLHTRIKTGVNGFAGPVLATLENGKILIATYYDYAATRQADVCYFVYDIQLKKTTYLEYKPQQTGCRLLSHVDSLVSCIETYNQGETSAT